MRKIVPVAKKMRATMDSGEFLEPVGPSTVAACG